MKKVKIRDLNLGDIIRLENTPYGDCTVKKIQDGLVTFFRPYVKTADFEYTGGVICYIGIEEWSVMVRDNREYELVQKGKEIK